ncbi:MAG: hypothetical protein QG670_2049 [Thermoproteota archaeon]|nr:hypothetical protein [Thermoproteota archaeon]
MTQALRRNPLSCPQTANVLARDLDQRIDQIESVQLFSTEMTFLQTTSGLSLTLVTAIILTIDDYHRLALVAMLLALIVGYMMRGTTIDKGPLIKRRELAYSLGCTFVGICAIFLFIDTFLNSFDEK